MNLTAVFESWHIGDGNYPPFHRRQLVNLSFEIEPKNIEIAGSDVPDIFEHLGNGEYHFCGNILKIYESSDRQKIVIVESNDFRFYFVDYEARSFTQFSKVCGEGTLLLDHYIWVEFLREYKDAPNLFYNLQVNRIVKVNIPEKFIHRHESGKSYPSRVEAKDFSDTDIEELETMEDQPFDEEFYIIELDSEGLDEQNIKRTFIS